MNDMVFRDPVVQSIISKSGLHKSKTFKSRDSEMRTISQRWKRGRNFIRDFFTLVKAETASRENLRTMHTEMHSSLGHACKKLLNECALVPTNSPAKALLQKEMFDNILGEKCACHCCFNCCPCNNFLISEEEKCAEQINSIIRSYQQGLCTLLGYAQRRKVFFRERRLQGGTEWENYILPGNKIFECNSVSIEESIEVNMCNGEEKGGGEEEEKKKKKKRHTKVEEPQEMSELTKKLRAFEGCEFPQFEDIVKEENELLEFERTLSSLNVQENRIKPIYTDSYLD